MFDNADSVADLDQKQTAQYVMDLFHRIIIHHALWYTEVRHQMGEDKAFKILNNAAKTSSQIQLKHLAKLFGFDMVDGIPEPLLAMEDTQLHELRERVAKNWLVNDGVWFQAIEFSEGMNEAKRCNDSCWAQFSPFEAESIREQLQLGQQPGLAGLKRALGFRVYANINTQSIVEETPESFVFQMNDCRVQSARKRKGLADYPCKSAGLVEYTYFARAIDTRITTECIGCPPDKHPDDWYCAWRFSISPE
ncbi:DUF6125 family protein [Desulfosediminicola flagellatus]|uniref:DUF6125 family protein n=1 Tax=Desulfosediminicola flagellatus TaxID=2569541 RepID=UPI0010AC6B20|nr:DUF6125 family protein [Desulfosediminicola flagellatus]